MNMKYVIFICEYIPNHIIRYNLLFELFFHNATS